MSYIKQPGVIAGEMESYFDRLWPLCRSITGSGYRQSLDILSELVPFETLEFKSGSTVFDWTVPQEWDVNKAFIEGPNGNRYAQFSENNLHLVSYSDPVDTVLPLNELQDHLHTLPDQPDAIPYLTNYYADGWGFCLTHEQYEALPSGDYRVLVDTEKKDGSIVLGEAVLPGESEKEILLSSYICHPSMANNELSGPLVLCYLYRWLVERSSRRFTYRFVLNPETIGSLCYLKRRKETLINNLVAGLVLTCVGDTSDFTFKKTREGNTLTDRAMDILIGEEDATTIPFDPYIGSDELQYNSPGFNFPVGSLMRSVPGDYPEYHTSLDNKDFINFEAMTGSLEFLCRFIDLIENNYNWVGTVQHGAPKLSKRGLYRKLGSRKTHKDREQAIFWFLNLADGNHDLIDMIQRSGKPREYFLDVIDDLLETNLIKSLETNGQ